VTTIVLENRLLFGPRPMGDVHVSSYASLEGPEAPDLYTPREREGFAAAPEHEEPEHEEDHVRTGSPPPPAARESDKASSPAASERIREGATEDAGAATAGDRPPSPAIRPNGSTPS
jgi:hypothetical protein